MTIISGCVNRDSYLVSTNRPEVNYEFSSIGLSGNVRAYFCEAENNIFVYDTVSHKNWSDYAFKLNDTFVLRPYYFIGSLNFSNIKLNITYYVRAVVYCYDFKKPFNDYEERYYQGEEKTFIVEYKFVS